MIKIKCRELRETLKTCQRQVEDYEKNSFQLHWIYEDLTTLWQSNRATAFLNCTKQIEMDNQKLLYAMKKELTSFLKILPEYEKMGDRIEYSPEKREYLIRKYDGILTSLEKVGKEYRVANAPSYALQEQLSNQEREVLQETKKWEQLKSKTKDRMEKIEEIERNFGKECSSIPKRKVEEILSFEAPSKEDSTFALFRSEEIELSSKKLESYLLLEKEILPKLRYYFEQILEFYQTPNAKRLEELHTYYTSSLEIIHQNHERAHKNLEKVLTDYHTMIKKNVQNLEEF